MAGKRGSDFTSPFDDMLEQNRRQFEELYKGPAEAQAPNPAALPAPGAQANPAPPTPSPAAASGPPARAFDPASDDPVRFLDHRYGAGWSYEVTERRREGDEVVVRCRLSIPDHDLSKAEVGRARIDRPDAAPEIAGSADGVSFALGPENGINDAEEAAYEQALANALAKCAALL